LIGKLVGTDDFSSGAREQYRKLAALLHHGQVERGLKVVMTSSALPGEGKSLTAVNLALTLSESYQRKVLLIDADLRRPTIQRIFGIPPVAGLNEILKSNEDTQMTVTQITERLFVLPAGRPDSDPISGLTSQRMQRVLADAAQLFDWVLVDTPPLGLLPDAGLLTSFVGGVLLVVRCGKAPYSLVRRTVDAVTRERILGVIMNAVDLAHDRNAGRLLRVLRLRLRRHAGQEVGAMAKGLIQAAHWRLSTLIRVRDRADRRRDLADGVRRASRPSTGSSPRLTSCRRRCWRPASASCACITATSTTTLARAATTRPC
jgi:capsular exopolysaccharide synthesis family protein